MLRVRVGRRLELGVRIRNLGNLEGNESVKVVVAEKSAAAKEFFSLDGFGVCM